MPETSDTRSLGSDAALSAGIARSLERVRQTGRTRWIAHVIEAAVADPLRGHAHAGVRDRFLWQRVEDDDFFCAWGCADQTESSGPGRFDDVRRWAVDVGARLDWTGHARPARAPTFLGGFGFEDESSASDDWKTFPAARFILPEVILERWQGTERWVLLVRVEPGASLDSVRAALLRRLEDAEAAHGDTAVRAAETTPEGGGVASTEGLPGNETPGPEYIVRADRRHARFEAQVRAALVEIASGRLAKVVLARSLCVGHDGDFDEPAFLDRLRALYPSCTLIAIGRANDSFLAATPETLVRMQGRRVETAALAGSAPRGRRPEEDRAFAAALLGSPKENAEHAHVVDAIRAVLAPRCASLEIPAAPRLRRLFGIQHLETPVVGRLRDARDVDTAIDVLEIVGALHPTPAVGGFPAADARRWLRRHEGLERGWYAAPVGWLDLEGGGDFRVALRSALIRNRQGQPGESGASRALLFGGVGIVAGSDPAAELVETRIKLRALLAPLTEI